MSAPQTACSADADDTHPYWCDIAWCDTTDTDVSHISHPTRFATRDSEFELSLRRTGHGTTEVAFYMQTVAVEGPAQSYLNPAELRLVAHQLLSAAAQAEFVDAGADSVNTPADTTIHVELGPDGQPMVTLSCGANTVVCTAGQAIHRLQALTGAQGGGSHA